MTTLVGMGLFVYGLEGRPGNRILPMGYRGDHFRALYTIDAIIALAGFALMRRGTR